jgi:hypothetical protein
LFFSSFCWLAFRASVSVQSSPQPQEATFHQLPKNKMGGFPVVGLSRGVGLLRPESINLQKRNMAKRFYLLLKFNRFPVSFRSHYIASRRNFIVEVFIGINDIKYKERLCRVGRFKRKKVVIGLIATPN